MAYSHGWNSQNRFGSMPKMLVPYASFAVDCQNDSHKRLLINKKGFWIWKVSCIMLVDIFS